MDQKFIEYELENFSNGKIHCVRLNFLQCCQRFFLIYNNFIKRLSLSDDYSLLLDKNEKNPITLIYFRAGYSPHDYPTDLEWQARLTMERSTAIKCPSIGLHLANTKKIQQVFLNLLNFLNSIRITKLKSYVGTKFLMRQNVQKKVFL